MVGGRKPGEPAPGVLVTDDDPALAQMLDLALTDMGFRVWTARGGAEAVQAFQREGADIAVLLLDVQMPGLDGPATLQEIRRSRPGIPCCFMSGNLGNHTMASLLALGAVDLIQKPFSLGMLAGKLRSLLEPFG